MFHLRIAEIRVRLIIGMSGSSGAIYGIRLLEVLGGIPSVETHLVMSAAAAQTIAIETDWKPKAVMALASRVYKIAEIAAPISSGSFPIDAMIVLPSSMKTVAEIAWGTGDNLLARAADVTLKEKRRLIVCPRETPLHLGHLRSLTQLAEIGAVIAPPMPAYYNRPRSLQEVVDHTVGRVLDLVGIAPEGFIRRWHGPASDD